MYFYNSTGYDLVSDILNSENFTILKIYDFINSPHTSLFFLNEAFENFSITKENGCLDDKLIYSFKFKEVTMEEVYEKFGCPVKIVENKTKNC